ncbi:MAG: RHS repeat domain-containing protein [Campylobacterota bacterium]|nr:RHS repeat domain-containing protein [Campylobacterota bacterium]
MPYLKPLLLLLLLTLTLTANIPPPIQSTTYDPTGNLSTITHANNTKEHYSYDDLNRLTAITPALSSMPSHQVIKLSPTIHPKQDIISRTL